MINSCQHARQAYALHKIVIIFEAACSNVRVIFLSMMKEKFSKPFTTYSEQLAILQERGLIISDTETAEAFLSFCNYYRFSGYLLAFEDKRHVLFPNTTFENVRYLYEFDRNLRCLVSEAIAEIEISVRTRIAQEIGFLNDPFFHRNKQIFLPRLHTDWDVWYAKITDETKRSQELFVKHFENKYTEFPDVPIWVLTELMSFGSLSKLYACLQPKYQKPASKFFGTPHVVLVSWLHSLTNIRNLCAHHSRLWDRNLSIPPKVPNNLVEFQYFQQGGSTWRLFYILSIIKFLLDRIKERTNVDIEWRQRIVDLLNHHPPVPNFERFFGLPNHWQRMDLWK
jgi:abortive infection bacteriophage resistance protein